MADGGMRSPATADIEPVTDTQQVAALLQNNGLPVDDVISNRQIEFYGIKTGSMLVGAVGLEVFGDIALLRSLAVTPGRRGFGLGRSLLQYAENRASTLGVKRIYLLTTTAGAYFEKLGYALLDRDLAPEAIRCTAQFSGICPSSAAFMAKDMPTSVP